MGNVQGLIWQLSQKEAGRLWANEETFVENLNKFR
jgi:hypothetical protein